MATKNIKIPVELHTQLKIESMLSGESLQDFVTEILYAHMDAKNYVDEYGKPIDMTNHHQVFLDRFGGIVPADSNMTFREYVDFVKDTEGVLRPHDEEY